jgi:hypothetical protein
LIKFTIITIIYLDSLEKAKDFQVFLNNFAVFYKGEILTHEILNKNRLKKDFR